MIILQPEVAIVGGGPAGCFSALQMARHNVDTVVFEEHEKIGVPSHCTGHVSLSGLNRLDLHLPSEIIENKIKSVIFYSPSGFPFKVRFPSVKTLVIDRKLFDQHIANLAIDAGVKIFRKTKVKALRITRRAIKGVIVQGKTGSQEIPSNVVIDAEGVSSRILKLSGLTPSSNQRIARGVHATAKNVDIIEMDSVEVFLSRSLTPGFFAWMVPKPDGSAKIGLATKTGNPRDCLRNFLRHNPVARLRLKESQITDIVYHPIPLGGLIAKTYCDGMLVVGDAASHVKPTTGGGIVLGLSCAKIAGEVAATAIQDRNYSSEYLAQYEKRCKRMFGFDMKAMLRIRLMLNNLSDQEFDRLVALCERFKLHTVLKETREVDLQGSSLIRMVKSPRLLLIVLNFLLASSF